MYKTRNKVTRKGINYEVLGARPGTHKDLGIDELISNAVQNEVNTICAITSGNYGMSIREAVDEYNATAAPEKALRSVSIVHPNIDYKLWRGLEGDNSMALSCSALEDTWLSPEDREQFVETELRGRSFTDLAVSDYTDFIPDSYKKEAEVILAKKLDYIFVPVGSGKTFITLYDKLKEMNANGKDIKTRLIGVVPKGENPIFHKFLFEQDGVQRIINYNPVSIANKLSCPYTVYVPQILEAIGCGHSVIEANNTDFRRADKAALKLGYDLEYSGAAAFVGLDRKVLEKNEICLEKDNRVGLFVTGKGIYSTSELEMKKIRRTRLKRFGVRSAAVTAALGIFFGLPVFFGIKGYYKMHTSIDKIVGLYEADPNTMGPILIQATKNTVPIEDSDPNQMREHLIKFSTGKYGFRLKSDDLSTILESYEAKK